MLNTRKLAPGQKGTKKLHEQFGDRLLCVRYRYDDQLRKRFKTVELIVEEAAWTPPATLLAANAIVGVRVGLTEVELTTGQKLDNRPPDNKIEAFEVRY